MLSNHGGRQLDRAPVPFHLLLGLTDEQEIKAVDKTTPRLPGRQDDMVVAVAAVAARTVVIVNVATPILMPWLESVDAVLWAGLPGQEAGHAVAATLMGSIEPAWRLVTTFPAADAATPAWSVVPDGRDLVCEEGAFIGYRGHHAQRATAPAFWFGHGLGYGTWEYADPRVTLVENERSCGSPSQTRVTVPARRWCRSISGRPTPTCPFGFVGWNVATAEPAQSLEVVVTCDRRMWRTWGVASRSWHELPVKGEFVIARGLADVRGVIRV